MPPLPCQKKYNFPSLKYNKLVNCAVVAQPLIDKSFLWISNMLEIHKVRCTRLESESEPSKKQKTKKGCGDGAWANQQKKKTESANGTTKLKPGWQVGRPWLMVNGLVGNRWTAKCRCCGCVINSKLSVIVAHEDSNKHQNESVIFEREERRKAAGLARWGAGSVAAAQAARIAADRAERDPETRGQIERHGAATAVARWEQMGAKTHNNHASS